jgi:pyruvate/2-oxoglutarate dehydrogenase complex dihydrolipoamide acyltransferase (E2) component
VILKYQPCHGQCLRNEYERLYQGGVVHPNDPTVRMYDNVDVNVLMGSGNQLYSPVLHNVGSRGLKSIAEELFLNQKNIEEGTVQVSFLQISKYFW